MLAAWHRSLSLFTGVARPRLGACVRPSSGGRHAVPSGSRAQKRTVAFVQYYNTIIL